MTPTIPSGFGLDTLLRRAHFFKRLVENLNYSAEALLRTWLPPAATTRQADLPRMALEG